MKDDLILNLDDGDVDAVNAAALAGKLRNESERDDVERFLRSGWFETLSNLDGETLLRQVQAMEVR